MKTGFKVVGRSALACCLLAGFAVLLSGSATIAGPVAGYVTGVNGLGLRAILGAPGSFRFSDPLPLPNGVSRLHIAPGQDFAVTDQNGTTAVLSLSGATSGRLITLGVSSPPDWVVFSSQSISAVLFSAATGHLQVLGGLPDSPRVSLDWDSAALGDVPRTAAVSDDGKTLLVASHRAVYLVPAGGGAPRQLLSAAEIVSLTLFRNGRDAAVWDGYAGSVHLLQDVASVAADRLLTSGLKGVGKLSPSWDGNTLFLVKSGVKSVFSIDVSSGEIQYSGCQVAPNALEPLRNRDTFLISAGRQQPAWIFYFDGSTTHVVFVPEPLPTTEVRQ